MALAAICAFAICAQIADSAPTFCTTIGLTKAAARKAFGKTVLVTLSPNQGEDIAACTIGRRGVTFASPYGVGAVVWAYASSNQAGAFELKHSVKKRLNGLGKGALLVTGPKGATYPDIGPSVLFTGGQYFIAIVANPNYKQEPRNTPAEVIKLAREIHSALN